MADNKKSNKDLYHEGFAKRNPDIDVNDEEAVYGRMNERADRLSHLEEMNDNFNKSINNSPMFVDMLMASQDNPNFDPWEYAIANGGVENFEEAIKDPDYLKRLAEANKKSLDMQAKDKQVKAEFQKNIGASLDAIVKKVEELGLDNGKAQEAFGKYYTACMDATEGKFYPEIFEVIAKGLSHDEDVQNARTEGVADGLNRKVNDTLRSIPEAREGNGGSQAAVQEQVPQPVDDDEDMFGLSRPRRRRNSTV